MDPESPQIVELSEGEISDSEQEDPSSRTPELDQLMLTAKEQLDYDSFALASPSVTRALLWKFAEETPSGSQTRPVTIQAQTVTSTPARPSGSQSRLQLKLSQRLQLKLSHRLRLKLSCSGKLQPSVDSSILNDRRYNII